MKKFAPTEISPKQLKIARLLGAGICGKEAMALMGLKRHAYYQHLARIVKKTGARSSTQLGVWMNYPIFAGELEARVRR